jgi:hypothetical protein
MCASDRRAPCNEICEILLVSVVGVSSLNQYYRRTRRTRGDLKVRKNFGVFGVVGG